MRVVEVQFHEDPLISTGKLRGDSHAVDQFVSASFCNPELDRMQVFVDCGPILGSNNALKKTIHFVEDADRTDFLVESVLGLEDGDSGDGTHYLGKPWWSLPVQEFHREIFEPLEFINPPVLGKTDEELATPTSGPGCRSSFNLEEGILEYFPSHPSTVLVIQILAGVVVFSGIFPGERLWWMDCQDRQCQKNRCGLQLWRFGQLTTFEGPLSSFIIREVWGGLAATVSVRGGRPFKVLGSNSQYFHISSILRAWFELEGLHLNSPLKMLYGQFFFKSFIFNLYIGILKIQTLKLSG